MNCAKCSTSDVEKLRMCRKFLEDLAETNPHSTTVGILVTVIRQFLDTLDQETEGSGDT